MISHTMRILAAALSVFALSSIAGAEDWPQWRGPRFNGSCDASKLPDKLDESTTVWSLKLPGVGSGTPVVSGDRIFVSCLDPQSKKLLGVCISRKDGTLLWRKETGLGFRQNDRNNMASPSAVTDGKMVWFYFGTGDLAAFDVDGNEKWARNLQKEYGDFYIQWIYASSPLLFKDKLYVQVLQRDHPPFRGAPAGAKPAESYLLAINPQTGQEIWRAVRPNDAVEESKESYGTPVPTSEAGRDEILLVGGDCVTAHDAASGKELWRAGGWNPRKIGHWRMVSSALGGDGLVFVCPPKGGAIFAVRDGGSGDVTASNIAWKSKELSSDVCVPLFYKDHLYVLDGDAKTISCADPKTGTVLWNGKLDSRRVFRASPTGADGKIYCMNEGGDVWVISADEFKVLGHSSLSGQDTRSSIVVSDSQVFVRTADKLWAFAQK